MGKCHAKAGLSDLANGLKNLHRSARKIGDVSGPVVEAVEDVSAVHYRDVAFFALALQKLE